MPRRTNKKQEFIALLRRNLAPEGFEIEESAMLTDAVTGDETEVDVVMRGALEDVSVVVSFEVVAWSRKAGRPWVHQMIRKHTNLPTQKLVLVS